MGAKVRRREKIMSKIDEVRAEMVAAMKNKDKERKDTLSMLLAALKNKAIDKREDLTEAEENDIILLHDCYDSSVKAALKIIDRLTAEGYEFVTVDELMMD